MKKLPAEINWQIKRPSFHGAFCLSLGQLTGPGFQGFASDTISLTLMLSVNPKCMKGCQNCCLCSLRLRELHRTISTNICTLYLLRNYLCCSTILRQKVEEIAIKSQSCNVNEAEKESGSGNLPVLIYFIHSRTTLMFLINRWRKKETTEKVSAKFIKSYVYF